METQNRATCNKSGVEPMLITELPLDIQLEIFKYLSLDELVQDVRNTCQLWCQLTYESVFWKNLVLSHFSFMFSKDVQYLKLLSQLKHCVEILIIDFPRFSLKVLEHPGIVCPNLKEIHIRGDLGTSVTIFLESLEVLSKKYPDLKGFCITGNMVKFLSWHEDSRKEEETSVLNKLFPNLQNLTVDATAEVTDTGVLASLLAGHDKLKSVSIRFCEIHNRTLERLLSSMPQIEKLDLAKSIRRDFSYDMDIETYDINLPNLKALNLAGCVVSDKFVQNLLFDFGHLVTLDLSCSKNVTNVSLECVAQRCPGLKHLFLDFLEAEDDTKNLTDAGLERVVENCHNLITVNLNECKELTDRSINAVAHNCPLLQELCIHGILSVTDAAIIAIAEKCQYLKILDVSFCLKLTGLSVSLVLTSCQHLKQLKADSCFWVADLNLVDLGLRKGFDFKCTEECGPQFDDDISDQVYSDNDIVLEIKKSCMQQDHSHVQEMSLGFCSKVTNACMIQISTYCKDLIHLDIKACPKITDAGIKSLIQGCKMLNHLNISGGSISQRSRLTDHSLNAIAEYGHSLKTLEVFKNSNISSDGVMNIAKHCKCICKISVSQGAGFRCDKRSIFMASQDIKEKSIRVEVNITSELDVFVHRNRELDYTVY